ncbi:MAG: hypothetical protein PWQ93_1022 [Clostridiales bacterium]|nr:hypothetical protein [Clostridiales bacterium]
MTLQVFGSNGSYPTSPAASIETIPNDIVLLMPQTESAMDEDFPLQAEYSTIPIRLMKPFRYNIARSPKMSRGANANQPGLGFPVNLTYYLAA